MADTQQQERSDQRTTEGQQNHEDSRDQAQFDSSFVQQLAGQLGGTQQFPQVQTSSTGIDWAREYYDSVESQIRSARRIAEAQSLFQMRQQIVAEVLQGVLAVISQQQALPTQKRR